MVYSWVIGTPVVNLSWSNPQAISSGQEREATANDSCKHYQHSHLNQEPMLGHSHGAESLVQDMGLPLSSCTHSLRISLKHCALALLCTYLSSFKDRFLQESRTNDRSFQKHSLTLGLLGEDFSFSLSFLMISFHWKPIKLPLCLITLEECSCCGWS